MFTEHLIHSVTLERATAQADGYGNRKKTWATLATGVKGRLVIGAQQVMSNDLAEYAIVTTYKLLLPAGTDVREGDRVQSVTLEDGVTENGPYSVASVLPRRSRSLHHITLLLERVGV